MRVLRLSRMPLLRILRSTVEGAQTVIGKNPIHPAEDALKVRPYTYACIGTHVGDTCVCAHARVYAIHL